MVVATYTVCVQKKKLISGYGTYNTCRHINIINYVLDVPLGLTIYTPVGLTERDSITQTIYVDGRAALTEVSAINSHHIITFGVYYNHQSFDSEEAILR